jgi:hypothetical protein
MLSDLAIWLNHFEYHAERPRGVPEGLPDVLLDEERELIAPSIATFQLAEQSDGARLLATAARFAQEHDLPALPRITELFVCEEQRHAALLKEFMYAHDIPPRRRRHWTDRVFRHLRRLAGIEQCVCVLLTAELIGNVYYRALEAATGCQRLKALCRTLVADELAHVGLESQVLLELRARRSPLGRLTARLAHRLLFVIASCAVFATHKRVLARAGFSAVTFVRACGAQYDFYLEPPAIKAASASMS